MQNYYPSIFTLIKLRHLRHTVLNKTLPRIIFTSVSFCAHMGHITKFPFSLVCFSSSLVSIFIISHDLVLQIYSIFSKIQCFIFIF
nr:MAG TPA: hypothetical protein [Bacteriophage sp.]